MPKWEKLTLLDQEAEQKQSSRVKACCGTFSGAEEVWTCIMPAAKRAVCCEARRYSQRSGSKYRNA